MKEWLCGDMNNLFIYLLMKTAYFKSVFMSLTPFGLKGNREEEISMIEMHIMLWN